MSAVPQKQAKAYPLIESPMLFSSRSKHFEPFHLSHSQAMMFSGCPYRWARSKLAAVPEADGWPRTRGAIAHLLFGRYAQACVDADVGALGEDEVSRIFRIVASERPMEPDLRQEVLALYEQFVSSHDFSGREGMTQLIEHEVAFTVPGTDEFPFSFRIVVRPDHVKVLGTACAVIDYKSQVRVYTRNQMTESLQLVTGFLGVRTLHPALRTCEGIYDFVGAGGEISPIKMEIIDDEHVHCKRLSGTSGMVAEEWDIEPLRHYREIVAGILRRIDETPYDAPVREGKDLIQALKAFEARPGHSCMTDPVDGVCGFAGQCEYQKAANVTVVADDETARVLFAEWLHDEAKQSAKIKAVKGYLKACGPNHAVIANDKAGAYWTTSATGEEKLSWEYDLDKLVEFCRENHIALDRVLSVPSNTSVKKLQQQLADLGIAKKSLADPAWSVRKV